MQTLHFFNPGCAGALHRSCMGMALEHAAAITACSEARDSFIVQIKQSLAIPERSRFRYEKIHIVGKV